MSLYDPKLERDNCGFGLLAHMEGEASHKLVRLAMSALARMQHRGGISADGKTGDGCGLLLQNPTASSERSPKRGWHLGRNYAVGMLFPQPRSHPGPGHSRHHRRGAGRETLSLVGWRKVPIDTNVLGSIAKASLPSIEQVFVNAPRAGSTRISSAASISCAAASRSASATTTSMWSASPTWSPSTRDCACRWICRASIWIWPTSACRPPSACSTSVSPPTPAALAAGAAVPLPRPQRRINTIAGNRQWAKARSYSSPPR